MHPASQPRVSLISESTNLSPIYRPYDFLLDNAASGAGAAELPMDEHMPSARFYLTTPQIPTDPKPTRGLKCLRSTHSHNLGNHLKSLFPRDPDISRENRPKRLNRGYDQRQTPLSDFSPTDPTTGLGESRGLRISSSLSVTPYSQTYAKNKYSRS